MSTASVQNGNYKVRCIEREVDRLIESVKQVRQNALALVAAVLVLTSAILGIQEPLVGGLRKAQYDGLWQSRLLGVSQTPERDAAVYCLTLLWNSAVLCTIIGGALTIGLAVYIFMVQARFSILERDKLESITEADYQHHLLRQYDELRNLNRRYRLPLRGAASFALVTVAGCGLVALLWLLFGGAGKNLP